MPSARSSPKPVIALAAASALLGGLLVAATLASGALWAQAGDEAAAEEPAEGEVAAPPPVSLGREERLMVGALEFQIDGVFTAASPDRPGYTEVRVAVTARNQGSDPIIYRLDAFTGSGPYPALSMIDSAGNEHAYRLSDGVGSLAPGSALGAIPSGLTGRWTVGFEVPAAYDDELTLRVSGAGISADYDLATTLNTEGWDPPPGVEVFEMGDQIAWGEEFVVTPFDHGALVCGDPNTQLVTQIFTVGMQVGNRSTLDADWPGVRFPGSAAVAQWPDGGSARLSSETFATDTEELFKWAPDAVRVPPSGDQDAVALVTYPRAFLFGVPRDARLGPVDDAPQGILLNRPDGSPAWLELGTPGELPLNPALCDTGNFAFTIPYSFAPGADFQVGIAGPALDAAAADQTAREILSEGLVMAGLHFDAEGNFDGVNAAALQAFWGGIQFADGFAATDVGVVSVSLIIEGEEDPVTKAVLATESESGAVFCVTAMEDLSLTFAEGQDLAAAEEVCLATVAAEAPPAEEPPPPPPAA